MKFFLNRFIPALVFIILGCATAGTEKVASEVKVEAKSQESVEDQEQNKYEKYKIEKVQITDEINKFLDNKSNFSRLLYPNIETVDGIKYTAMHMAHVFVSFRTEFSENTSYMKYEGIKNTGQPHLTANREFIYTMFENGKELARLSTENTEVVTIKFDFPLTGISLSSTNDFLFLYSRETGLVVYGKDLDSTMKINLEKAGVTDIKTENICINRDGNKIIVIGSNWNYIFFISLTKNQMKTSKLELKGCCDIIDSPKVVVFDKKYYIKSANEYILYKVDGETGELLGKIAIGDSYSDYANTFNGLAELYLINEYSSKAESLYMRAIEIYKNSNDKKNAYYRAVLNNLARLYMTLGKYSKAEPLYIEVLEIDNASNGGKHHYYQTLNKLALLYFYNRKYSKAEQLFFEELERSKKVFGKDHPNYATALNNLAALYEDQGQYSKAEPLYLKSLEITKHAFRENHPDYATTLNNLGLFYLKLEQYSKAEPLLLKSLEKKKKVLGEDHPDYATTLNNLAELYRAQGQFSKAEPLYLKALEIWKHALGENHPNYALGLGNSGFFYFTTSRPDSARPLMLEALPIVENHIQDTFAILTERQRMSFVKDNRHYFDWYLTLFDRKGDEKDAYNHFLKWKGVVLNSMKAQKEFLDERAAKDPEFRKKLDDYQDILHYQSMLLTKQGLKEGEKEELKRATKEREEIERGFAREDASYRKERELQKITVDNICSALKPDEAIVDYLKYTKSVLKKGEEKNDIDWIDSYLAFIVRGGKDCTNPVRIELGEAEDIEKLTDKYRKLFENPKERANDPTDPDGISFELMKKIWKPLEQHLGDRKKVWIIPDGALGGVSFQTLKTDKDEYLIDKYDIRYLDNSADLYRAAVIKRDSGRKTALFAGNIDFGEKEKTDDKCFPTDMEELYDETGAVRNLLKQNKIKTTVYEKNKATRPAVFEGLKSSPGIVHISTHGFYLPDECVTKAPVKFEEKDNEIKMLDKKDKVEADPMSRSGIVFAGVNDPEQREYAIATGIDFSGLNLRNTDLFVLSACQSGMGGMTEGEGVVGMRRALSMAGVKTIVSTLWDAEDTMTKQIMKEFYDGYLKTGKPHETMKAIQKKYRAQYPDRYLLWGFLAVSGATD